MMSSVSKVLNDDSARRDALSLLDRSMLVEAGAGSGKTAVMAGRIALLLASGIQPHSIAAVTFTELAASELLSRVREFVAALSANQIAPELRIALPNGLSKAQLENLASASVAIDEMTCSTIHGFCQRLIKPYPVEADIDPGATIMDRSQADLTFLETADAWLRERLSGERGGVLAEMVLENPSKTVTLIYRIADNLRRRRALKAPSVSTIEENLTAFKIATTDFVIFLKGAPATEPDTDLIAVQLTTMLADINACPPPDMPAGLVRLLSLKPHPELWASTKTFKAYRKKGKWEVAAKQAGLSKADGERLNIAATGYYQSCCDAWMALHQSAASQVLSVLIDEVRTVVQRYRIQKRASANLDFDDLIFAARDLLRDHDDVRRDLGQRFSHVLVDEFQDTDPLQTEIFWRLCGDPESDEKDYNCFQIRPGALFLVGDPKQAIYRFRGADVSAYVHAREAFRRSDPQSLLSISTNFRSKASILTFVNERFEALLSADGQPGFTPLDPFFEDQSGRLSVAAIDIEVADQNGKASSQQQRDGEAEAVALLCARLIGTQMISDRKNGSERACQPGDIAFLAPTGTDLWRYEEALERRGIPVATQAGKGLFRRQEVQDLIALTRVLADRRDTLAFGALLRGPLVGLSEEELLDAVWSLPPNPQDPKKLPRLDLNVDAALIKHPLLRDIVERLQALNYRVNSTTPNELLSQAVDMMRVRPIILARHQGQAERALANVELYLSLSNRYSVRGLRAFAEAMTSAWTDEARAVEGRPDAQEEAIALFTMHAAKGLEWPIVIPINTMTSISNSDTAVVDKKTEIFYCPVFGVDPEGSDAARDEERAELDRERIRLWYVAATRARELLVLPRLNVKAKSATWMGLIDLSLAALPSLDVAHMPEDIAASGTVSSNLQTRSIFATEAEGINDRQTRLTWLAPSRDEGAAGEVVQEEPLAIWMASSSDELGSSSEASAAVQGGRERGLILHKLMEEVLTGETEGVLEALIARADDLIRALGRPPVSNSELGLSGREMAGCVVRTLALPDIAPLRPGLLAEFPVYSAKMLDGAEAATVGIADALTITSDGRPSVVVDWKSDVAPDPKTLEHYRAQVCAYLDMTGADRGLIVLMTTGAVLSVMPSRPPTSAP